MVRGPTSMALSDAFSGAGDEGDHPTELNLPNPRTGAAATGRTRLVIVNESILSTYVLPRRGVVVLGRGPEAEVFVPHPSVSRRHAIIRTDRDRVTIEDLGSSNGTTVNNLPIEPETPIGVTPADAIRIGKVVLILQRDWDASPKASADSTAHLRTVPDSAADFVLGGEPFVVRADSMERLLQLADRVAQTGMSVLVSGETGTGKEMFARLIHDRSKRGSGPFLGLNCAALTETLLESELFGHEKGAFTDAHTSKIGLFEKAAGGTVFLDEIGDMSLAIQAKLLRVFEDRNVLRLGSLETRAIDVRFVTATNKDLASEVAAGRFRKDFLFRMSGVTLHVPPLRERTV